MSYHWLLKQIYPDPSPKVAAFLLTRKCNYLCQSCCFRSTPELKGHMTVEDIELFLNSLKKGSVRVVVFTGGEPTLFRDELDYGIKRARELGFHTRIVSNGWWAKDKFKAYEYLSHLKNQGLQEFDFSYDEFHAPFIDINTVKNLIEVSSNLDFQNVSIAVVVNKNDRYFLNNLLEELGLYSDPKYYEMIRSGAITLTVSGLSRSGRGAQVKDIKYWGESRLMRGCTSVLSDISIAPNGDLIVCCGGILEIPYLRIGNLHEEPFDSIMKRALNNPIWKLMFYEGPTGLARFIQRFEPDWKLPDPIQSMCEACSLLFSTKGRHYLHKYLPELTQIVESRMENINHTLSIMTELAQGINSEYCVRCGKNLKTGILCCKACDDTLNLKLGMEYPVDDFQPVWTPEDKFLLAKLLLEGLHRHFYEDDNPPPRMLAEAYLNLIQDFSRNLNSEIEICSEDVSNFEQSVMRNLIVQNYRCERYRCFLDSRMNKLLKLREMLEKCRIMLLKILENNNPDIQIFRSILEDAYAVYHWQIHEFILQSTEDNYQQVSLPFEDDNAQYYRTILPDVPEELIEKPYESGCCISCSVHIQPGRLLCKKCREKASLTYERIPGIRDQFALPSPPFHSERYLGIEDVVRRMLEAGKKGKLDEKALKRVKAFIEPWKKEAERSEKSLDASESNNRRFTREERQLFNLMKKQHRLTLESERAFLNFCRIMGGLKLTDAKKTEKLLNQTTTACAWLDLSEALSQNANRIFNELEYRTLGDVNFFPAYSKLSKNKGR